MNAESFINEAVLFLKEKKWALLPDISSPIIAKFKSKVKCIAFQDLKNMLDNNIPFWSRALEIVKNLKQS